MGQDHDLIVVAVEDDLLQDAGHVARRPDVLVLGLAVGPVGPVEEPPAGVEGHEAEALGGVPLARPAGLVARREHVGVEGRVEHVLDALEAVLAGRPVPVAGHHDDLALEAAEGVDDGAEGALRLGASGVVFGREPRLGDVPEEDDRGVLAVRLGGRGQGAQDRFCFEVGRVAREVDRMGDLALGERGRRLVARLGSEVGARRGATGPDGEEDKEEKQTAHQASVGENRRSVPAPRGPSLAM